jgi:hypothetical protein
MNEIRKFIRNTISEYVTPRDLKDVENYADSVFSDLNIDVEFTKHFLDRVNDPRNGEEITPDELKSLYKKAHDKYGRNIANLRNGDERVVNDVQTDINIPVAISGTKPDTEMVAKTVMRKKNFLTPPMSPKLKV